MLDEAFDARAVARATPRWTHRTAARFQDVDAAGILFFARIFDHFHQGWLAYLEERGLPHADVVRAREWGAPLRRAHAEYLAPVRFGDKLDVGLVRAHVSGSDLAVYYRLDVVGGPVAAVGYTHHVFVAMAAMKRRDPPADVRAAFERLDDVRPPPNLG